MSLVKTLDNTKIYDPLIKSLEVASKSNSAAIKPQTLEKYCTTPYTGGNSEEVFFKFNETQRRVCEEW